MARERQQHFTITHAHRKHRSVEAMFDMHDTYTVANGKIVLASSGGTRKIKK